MNNENKHPGLTTEEKGSDLIKRVLLLVIAFLAVAAVIFIVAGKTLNAVSSDAQKVIYPLFAGILMGALATIFLYAQTGMGGKKQRAAWFFPVVSGVLALLVMMIAYIGIGMWPVGEKSCMIVDMHHQYLPMLSKMRDTLLGGGNFLYSFEVGSGTSFIPLFAYYMASPLNILLVLFPFSVLDFGVLVITLIKVGLAGAMMALCLQYIYRRRDWSVAVVSTMYALMMYMIAYSWNIMWLDAVFALPLVVMAFERLMRTGKYLLYVISLAYVLYCNYYIGFMVCIFLVLYYIAFFFRKKRSGAQQSTGFLRFLIGSALAGGIAAFILIPTYMSLSSTSAAGGSFPALKANFDIFELFGRQLYGASPTIRSGNLPNIYCGVLSLVALPIFLTTKAIPIRRRLAYFGVYVVMTLSLLLNQWDLLWHGLHSPNDLPYRFSFLYCFILLLMVYEVLHYLSKIQAWQIGLAVAAVILGLVLQEHFDTEKTYGFTSIYVSLGLTAAYALVLFLGSRKKLVAKAAYALLLTIVCGEMVFGSVVTLTTLNSNEHYTAHDTYLDNDTTVALQTAVDRMNKMSEEKFYRVEFLPRRTCADTALYGYKGITVFASSGSYNFTRYMGALGYDVNGVNSQMYKSYMPSADALMGIKYIASNEVYGEDSGLTVKETVTAGSEQYSIYENAHALSIGYMTDNATENYQYSYYNPVESQNQLYKLMTGTTENILNLNQIKSDTATVSGASAFSISGAQTTNFDVPITLEGRVFVYVDCRAAKSINVTNVANNKSYGVTTYEPFIIDVGQMTTADTVKVAITTEGSAGGNIYVATLDNAIWTRDYEMLADEQMTVTQFSDTKICGTVNAQKDGILMTSVPFDKGWTVKVDGKKVDITTIGTGVIGVKLDAGEHQIEMTFFPKGLGIGIGVTVVSIALLVFLCDFLKRRNEGRSIFSRAPKKKAEETAAPAAQTGTESIPESTVEPPKE